MYFGSHLGIGRFHTLRSGNLIDIYGRYSYTYLQGAEALVDGTDPVKFEPATSHKARVGGRFITNLTALTRFQAGLGYEHEFDSRTKATTNGYRINTVDQSGGTAVGEIGIAYLRPGPTPISLGFGLEGYLGKRRGISANLKLTVSF
jgi:hypothetical protein